MDPRTSVLTLLSAVLAAVTRALNSDTTFATWSKRLRAIVLLVVGTGQAVVDSLVTGTPFQTAVLAAVTTTAPSFVILLVEYLSDLKGGGGSGGGGQPKSDDKPTKVDPPPAGRSAGPYSALSALAACLVLTGCAGWQTQAKTVLDDVLLVGQDAAQILEAIRGAEALFFLAHPDTAAQVKVEKALSDASVALDAAIQTVEGTKDISAERANEAFDEFRKAYADLLVLLKSNGIAGPAPEGRLALYRGSEWKTHEPIVMRRRVGE